MSALRKPAPASEPIHEVIVERWSPRAFDPRPVESDKLRALFEAARWSASSYNAQPWSFVIATKDDSANFQRVLGTLIEQNQNWAKAAPVIGFTVARLKFEHNGQPNRCAVHDVGQAAAHLALQATHLGLQVHQMAGIDPEKAKQEFHVPDGYDVVAGFALGYPGDPSTLPEPLREREVAARQRKPISSFVFSGDWGKTSSIVETR
jgi:nitroreductase